MNTKCGCGEEGRYTIFENGIEKFSCNKYQRCLTYEEQDNLIKKLASDVYILKNAVSKIVRVNAMDYEYKTWAKEALDSLSSNKT